MNPTSQPGLRASFVLAAVACLAATGCSKKIRVPALPPAPPPVIATVTIPPPTHHTDELPKQEAPAPVAVTPPAIQKPRPKRSRKPAPHPTETAAVATPALPSSPATSADPSPIGELTTGGEAGTQGRQEAESLLNTVQKRLDQLSEEMKKDHQDQVERVRLFVKRAQEAWKMGDLEGARTLATKANVLLDDISK
ncbi:lipoprotein [Terriglobus saanensis]|uniref:Putative lipoprotein n=1 Tax=Terriglobus saanensis (strain ATCC BAA-1853 / DSM 23119 / SP1PR4) TaxID=401053 RepID=E8V0C1_TERSS|nr:lipoprotein [Terriglobus saanensis]ADV83339.1 putative lipoprotein [Terriglobus saanensis SP1PR4]